MESFKYYTLFGVSIKKNKNLTTSLERDFILRWSSNERESAELAVQMMNNKIFKTSEREALDSVGLNFEALNINGIRSRMRFCPEISAHLFETDFVMTNKDVDIMIKAANVCDSSRELLVSAKVNL